MMQQLCQKVTDIQFHGHSKFTGAVFCLSVKNMDYK
jgi:hypothetical protein